MKLCNFIVICTRNQNVKRPEFDGFQFNTLGIDEANLS